MSNLHPNRLKRRQFASAIRKQGQPTVLICARCRRPFVTKLKDMCRCQVLRPKARTA